MGGYTERPLSDTLSLSKPFIPNLPDKGEYYQGIVALISSLLQILSRVIFYPNVFVLVFRLKYLVNHCP